MMVFMMVSNVIWLVVDLPLWKMMEFVNGKDDIPYVKWKIKMFQTSKPPTSICAMMCKLGVVIVASRILPLL